MRLAILCFLVLSLLSAHAQNGTEIYQLDLTERAGQLTLSNPRNVSDKLGYDNQPFFHPNKPLLYYTSMMADGQTDIWSYDLNTSNRTQLTRTPDSEYSPTVLPSERQFSCIVQRKANGDQDLVQFDLNDPTKTSLLLESQKAGKIGYQAWLNADEAVVFVLGEPNTLHYLNRKTSRDTVIASQIGRSLHRVPGQQAFSFVQQVSDKWLIRLYEPARNRVRDLTESAPTSDHYNAWTPGGLLLESRGTELWAFNPKTNVWKAVSLPDTLPKKKLTRLAATGKWLAVVLDE